MAVFRTHAHAPRVLIANSNLVGRWATWEHFRELERAGLMMYGQMTAGSWIYIGTQGILQGTYETFGAMAQSHFGGSLAGRWILTGGMGGMGGAQPLAATMNGAAALVVEVDATRIRRRIETRYCDEMTSDLEEAVGRVVDAAGQGKALSVGLAGELRGGASRTVGQGGRSGYCHRSDLGPRSAERLRSGRTFLGGRGIVAGSATRTNTTGARWLRSARTAKPLSG